jgi:hypothetical protein
MKGTVRCHPSCGANSALICDGFAVPSSPAFGGVLATIPLQASSALLPPRQQGRLMIHEAVLGTGPLPHGIITQAKSCQAGFRLPSRADHIEQALIRGIELTPEDRLTAGQGILQGDVPTWAAGKRLR